MRHGVPPSCGALVTVLAVLLVALPAAGYTGAAYGTDPLDGRPHVPPHIRPWYGDSVGHGGARLFLMPLALVAPSCQGCVVEPQVTEEQAVDIARRQVLFEPEEVDAELAADADPPVWRVTLRGRLPGQSVFEFEEATVTVDAVTGDVIDVDNQ